MAKLFVASAAGAGPRVGVLDVLKLLVFFTSLIFVTGSVASEARPFRNQLIPECNVSMPCDFSDFQADRRGVERHARRLLMRQKKSGPS